jgi:hypothetical protein
MPAWHIILVASPALRANITVAVEEDHKRHPSTRPDDHGQGRSGALTREHLVEAPLYLAVTYDLGRGCQVPS